MSINSQQRPTPQQVYLYANPTQFTALAHQSETLPTLHHAHPSSSHHSNAAAPAFFTKLKGISRSRTPTDLRTTSALSSYSNMVEQGFSTSGNISGPAMGSHWSPDYSPTSPHSKYKEKGGFLKRSFSPTLSGAPGVKGSKSAKKTHHAALKDDFDPTTFRKHRSHPRKAPEHVYHEYDDLFDDSLDGEDATGLNVSSDNDYDYSGSDDGFTLTYEARHGSPRKQWEPPRSPPRSVPSPISSHQKNEPPNGSFCLAKWKISTEVDTPPQSKPPSVSELHPPSPLYAHFTLPPTPPPPKPVALALEQLDVLERECPSPLHSDGEYTRPSSSYENLAIPSPGPPPGHAPPPVPPSSSRHSLKCKQGSVISKRESFRRGGSREENNTAGLGIVNVALLSQSDSQFPDGLNADHIKPVVPLFSGTTEYKIPRKDVGSLSKAEALNTLMSEAKEISKHVGGTGYTPQMRITDVRDLDNEFAFTAFNSPKSSPRLNTMKEVVVPDTHGTSPIALDTMKEVVIEPAQCTQSPAEASSEKEVGETNKEAPKPDATYLRVFRQFLKSSGENDAFIHRCPRFDALQTQRICTHLRHDYPAVPVRKAKNPAESTSKSSRMIRQREVADQMLTSMWALMSLRWMMFGHVIISPAQRILAAANAKKSATVDSRHLQAATGSPEKDRKRVLDLGGNPIGDWGWHCAYDYPKAKVYTVTARCSHSTAPEASPISATEPGNSNTAGQKLRGPKNHRHLTVSYLWRLPFPENHFDVVSARSLFTTLKVHQQASRNAPNVDLMSPLNIMDEYDLCLEECLRVLKPGGYLEFFLLDNDIINPGPLASDLSAKFTSELEANAYDPYPTQKWIQRLNKRGYGDIKRAWLFLPMAPQSKPKPPAKEDVDYPAPPQRVNGPSEDIEAAKEEVRRKMEAWEDLGVKKGATEIVAPVTGVLGSWVWEKWMLKTSAEAGKNSDWRLQLDTIGSVLEEARDMKSGWRAMVGWARKPMVSETYTSMRMRAGSANSTSSTFR
ncbi:hypothetical protein BDZ91DRAFT_437013 [Kalaharituber pfeilii]|nr:hypothetical protein BDZ91DRAFT_437013 [Kalaharituber pfeilii]